jgi:hypothetical protein
MESLNILVRDSLFGQLLNYASKGRFFSYNEPKTLKDEDLPSPDSQRWIIVGFVGPDDPDIPRNWPTLARTIAGLNVLLLNFSFYAASALFTPSILGIEEAFGATTAEGTLGLSLFVIAYGIGPLIVCLRFKKITGTRNVLIMHVSSFLLCQTCRPSGVRRYMCLAALRSACSTSERLAQKTYKLFWYYAFSGVSSEARPSASVAPRSWKSTGHLRFPMQLHCTQLAEFAGLFWDRYVCLHPSRHPRLLLIFDNTAPWNPCNVRHRSF